MMRRWSVFLPRAFQSGHRGSVSASFLPRHSILLTYKSEVPVFLLSQALAAEMQQGPRKGRGLAEQAQLWEREHGGPPRVSHL